MGLGSTLVLGTIAGITILIGMPLGRLRGSKPVLQLFLNALAIGVLLFLVWDVLSGAWEPLDARMAAVHEDSASLGPVFGYGALFVGGLAVGLLGLVAYDRYLNAAASGLAVSDGGAPAPGIAGWSAGRRL
ncbi:MAG: hypothetical protein ACJ72O_10540, partial [Marmoricola sp.]